MKHVAPAFVRLTAHPLRWRLLSELADGVYQVRELVTLVGEPQNLVSYHLRLLREGGLGTATRSSFDGRDSYYYLDLDCCADALADAGAALHPALRREPAQPMDQVDRGACPAPACCSCAPATAPAHRSARPCYATARAARPR
jgi:DNA-binding transcriptional ArsR family regulator